ncbi:uncharacterized protein BX664DRAFT_346820 [Halteromyces radiatus]|uniref:uncharacterized protein n=1 Tax=Halteromyces radiatus TaxID=101107 RepID=UPI0022208A55|nr:uncharacterized protein BX664DRAFT_346820 [Halteromyces radiatus]KAI8096785.1 hypothetical protein BX664DRAFT_346820 [Halteromyces radiatus]
MQSPFDTIVKLCFKHTRLSPSVLFNLSQALYIVALGLRTTHLIDYHLTPNQAKQLLQHLRKHKDGRDLILLQFTDRYTFIGHRKRLLERCHSSVKEICYIDVQGKIPFKLDKVPDDLQEFLEEQLQPYVEQLEKTSIITNDKDDEKVFMVSNLPCFMVALTGWLLEYPMVYVCHQVGDIFDEWEPRVNCLGNIPLVWVKLQIQEKQLMSTRQQPYSLLSFTYPTCILPTAKEQQQVVDHLRNIFSARLSSYCSSMRLIIHQEIVTLDRVAL